MRSSRPVAVKTIRGTIEHVTHRELQDAIKYYKRGYDEMTMDTIEGNLLAVADINKEVLNSIMAKQRRNKIEEVDRSDPAAVGADWAAWYKKHISPSVQPSVRYIESGIRARYGIRDEKILGESVRIASQKVDALDIEGAKTRRLGKRIETFLHSMGIWGEVHGVIMESVLSQVGLSSSLSDAEMVDIITEAYLQEVIYKRDSLGEAQDVRSLSDTHRILLRGKYPQADEDLDALNEILRLGGKASSIQQKLADRGMADEDFAGLVADLTLISRGQLVEPRSGRGPV